MKFIDEAEIDVQAGDGGSGCKHFRREKFVPLGGPDGGNGGRGGSVIFVADQNKHTLLDFHYQALLEAESGKAGQGSGKDGRAGEDLLVHVPVGTQVLKVGSRELVADLFENGQQAVIAKGGRGGKGNAYFKSATNRTPEHFQPGEPGARGTFILSLKLVADVGLVGFPNAGKSTLISRISAARPKIADYPFTTLTPNLGVVQAKGGRNFVVADIPGLIPGAHEGKGLGIKFLKHVERTRLIAHLVDPLQLKDDGTPLAPNSAYDTINRELKLYSEELSKKPQVIVLTKADSIADRAELEKTRAALSTKYKCPCCIISSVSGEGIPELIELLSAQVLSAP
ncbi:MAG: GTPase ObgE [Oligoflexia bacterium]|nr:GTPase ObgE [Oligoflexia bacterium]